MTMLMQVTSARPERAAPMGGPVPCSTAGARAAADAAPQEWRMTACVQERFAGPAPRGEGQRLRIRSGAVVALFAFNVSVYSTYLNTTLYYTNAAARRLGHQHRRDYTRLKQHLCRITTHRHPAPQGQEQGHADAKMVDDRH